MPRTPLLLLPSLPHPWRSFPATVMRAGVALPVHWLVYTETAYTCDIPRGERPLPGYKIPPSSRMEAAYPPPPLLHSRHSCCVAMLLFVTVSIWLGGLAHGCAAATRYNLQSPPYLSGPHISGTILAWFATGIWPRRCCSTSGHLTTP